MGQGPPGSARCGGRAAAPGRRGGCDGADEPWVTKGRWAWAAEPSRYASSVPETLLTSHRNPRFRAALALRESSERRSRQRIVVDGAREIERAIARGVVPVEAWIAAERIERAGSEAHSALAAVRDARCELVEASPELIARLGYGERDDGIVLIAEMPSVSIERLALAPDPLIAVVEGVEKPGNLGA